jgi:arylsulfatase A-like enzyme
MAQTRTRTRSRGSGAAARSDLSFRRGWCQPMRNPRAKFMRTLLAICPICSTRRGRRACGRWWTVVVALATAIATSTLAAAQPNVVIILADDVGFSDLGAYGSEIRTPNIDALAARGLQFANFHTSPTCAPSRAMLMTGVDSHLAGIGILPEATPLAHRDQPGYRGRLADDVVTVASRLQRAGYRTYMTGKWHLGKDPASLPPARGFDRSFALEATGADNWEQRTYLPIYSQADWFEDGAPATLPEDFYSSAFLVDRMIDYLDTEPASEQPFFAYLAFQAIHIPVQAPREFTDRYADVYTDGWDSLREQRFAAVRARGLIPPDAPLGPMPAGLRDWDALAAAEQALLARSMAVAAGMLEAMDFHVGRLIAHLEQTGQLNNTVFLVLSDNGPEPNNPTATPGFSLWLRAVGYRRDLETLGERGSYAFIGPEFANAAAAPGALFKFYAGEGGLRVPLIVAGPGIERRGIVQAFSYITDITPTLLDLAGVAHPVEFEGRAVQPITGRSLVPLFENRADRVYADRDTVSIESAGNAAVFRGDYKVTRNAPPFGDGLWRLYHLTADPGETRDLADQMPERFAEMLDAYAAYAARVGVLEMPANYRPMRQLLINRAYDRFMANRAGIALILLVVIALLWGWRLRRLRRQQPDAPRLHPRASDRATPTGTEPRRP